MKFVEVCFGRMYRVLPKSDIKSFRTGALRFFENQRSGFLNRRVGFSELVQASHGPAGRPGSQARLPLATPSGRREHDEWPVEAAAGAALRSPSPIFVFFFPGWEVEREGGSQPSQRPI